MKPRANASRKSVAAVRRGMPIVIMIGSTIEPTMMIAPSPVNDVNSSATAPHKRQREQRRAGRRRTPRRT